MREKEGGLKMNSGQANTIRSVIEAGNLGKGIVQKMAGFFLPIRNHCLLENTGMKN